MSFLITPARRLSAMTGLQRQDVSQILREGKQLPAQSVISRVLGQWVGDRRFATAEGVPLALSCEGRESDFAALVASVSRELNPYAILFELERLQLVRRNNDSLELLSAFYIISPSPDAENALRLLGADIMDLIDGVDENAFSQPQIPNLHLKSQYDNLALEELPAIRQWILEEGSIFIYKVQQHLMKFDKDLNPHLVGKPGGGRVAVGVFSNSSPKKAGS